MLDVQRPAQEVIAAMATRDIYIALLWPAWPNHVRITVGTPDEMIAFRKTFQEVMSSSTSGLVLPKLPLRQAERLFAQVS